MKEEDSNSWKRLQQKSLNRRNLIRGAGAAAGAGLLLGSAGATSLPTLLPNLNALAGGSNNGHRVTQDG